MTAPTLLSVRRWPNRWSGVRLALGVTCAASTALAHHSYALYEMNKTLSTKAVLMDFHWGAPHSSASFVIKGNDGKDQILTLQGAAPVSMARAGFNPKDMRRGIKVEISWHPTRSGTPGGTLTAIKFPDGRVFTDNEYQFQEGQPPDASLAPPAP